MRKSNLEMMVESALKDSHSREIMHDDNGYVDSHTDNYTSDGPDYSDSSSSNKKPSGGAEGFFKFLTFAFFFFILMKACG